MIWQITSLEDIFLYSVLLLFFNDSLLFNVYYFITDTYTSQKKQLLVKVYY